MVAHHPGRAEDRVSGEIDFPRRGEQAHPVAAVGLRRRHDEGGLRIIGFRRDALHGLGGQIVSVEHHRQRISRVGLLGEDIDDVKAVRHGMPSFPVDGSVLALACLRKMGSESRPLAGMLWD
jgi:hypothetical protein